MQSEAGTKRTLACKTALSTSILAFSVFGYALTGNGADAINGSGATSSDVAASVATESPIKNVIILIGENRGLDHTFGVYKSDEKGQTISNILLKGIVNEDEGPVQTTVWPCNTRS